VFPLLAFSCDARPYINNDVAVLNGVRSEAVMQAEINAFVINWSCFKERTTHWLTSSYRSSIFRGRVEVTGR
jgi:hypothetical protein